MPLDNNATETSEMKSILDAQKVAFLRDGIPTAKTRIEWLDRCIAMLIDNENEICDALTEDFGHRSKDISRFADVASSIGPLKNAKKNVRKWMRNERRSVETMLAVLGSKAHIRYQPKGVVGVISPWNFPVQLTFAPLAGIFAAGNRAMIKPSEFTEHTSNLMKRMIEEYFSPEVAAVVTGGPEVGAEFSSLPFDHMLFTGATSIAYHVMSAAAKNLVPLTLELGGKSPVVLGKSADMEKAATRIMAGKTLNAGQICLAPDYAFIPEGTTDAFVNAAEAAVSTMYPTGMKDNDEYTSMINQQHYDRVMGLIDDAKTQGARVLEINPNSENFTQQEHYKIPPHIILDPSDDMGVMQDEIFGPVLPVKSYSSTDEAIDYINSHQQPLGLYYFGSDKSEQEDVINRTRSGGVTVNDVIFHVAQEDLPFGGIGPSGMGAYHGREGFYEFSHNRAVYTQTGSEMLKMMRPPYGDTFRKQITGRIKP